MSEWAKLKIRWNSNWTTVWKFFANNVERGYGFAQTRFFFFVKSCWWVIHTFDRLNTGWAQCRLSAVYIMHTNAVLKCLNDWLKLCVVRFRYHIRYQFRFQYRINLIVHLRRLNVSLKVVSVALNLRISCGKSLLDLNFRLSKIIAQIFVQWQESLMHTKINQNL